MRVRTCHLEPGALREAEDWLGARHTTWEDRLDRLGDVLTQPGPITDEEKRDD